MFTQPSREKYIQNQYIQVDGVRTRYWQLGDKGTTVIFLHGLGGYVELWRDNIIAFAQYHRVYAVDMVGFGESGKPKASYSLDSLARFIKAFMDALSIECASLTGCSLGGAVALQFALMFPKKLEKLVLISSVGLGSGTTPLFCMAALPFVSELLTNIPGKISVAWLFKRIVYDTKFITNEIIETSYRMSVAPESKRAYLAALRTNAQYFGISFRNPSPLLAQLPTIIAPTFIIWGKQDRIVPVRHAYVAKSNLPNACLHTFDECGHWPAREHLEEFNVLVLKFLASD